MIVRIGKQGKSFRGAGKYYLHDKHADTAHRVEHVETRNLPTDNPELGWRVMAATAMDSDRLKREAGVDRRGRKLTKPVFHISLSWHPQEHPDHDHMVRSMDSALAALNLDRAQACYVIHGDEPHSHIHAFLSVVDPDNGRSMPVKFSKEKMSRWAEEYEREHGIHCEERVRNNARRQSEIQKRAFKKATGTDREKAQFPRHKEKSHDLKAEINRRYLAADNGKAFQAAMEELGFKIAQGKRIVFIDKHGNTHSATRQLDGVTAAQLREKLQDIELPRADELPRDKARGDRSGDRISSTKASDRESRTPPQFSRKHAREEIYFDRDAQHRRQDERVVDAGLKHDKEVVRTGLKNRVQDAHHDQWGAFLLDNDHRRQRLNRTLESQYGEHERALRESIAAREQTIARSSKLKQWMARNFSRENEMLENDRRSLATIEQRRAESVGALELSIEQRRAALSERQEQEKADIPTDFTPRELDPLARSIAQQQAEANAAYLGAAAPADTQAQGASAAEASTHSEQEADRAAFMERMNGDLGGHSLGLGGPGE